MTVTRTVAKTTLPDLTRAIPRPRLIRQVEGTGSRVILITGQAAQGKSTLAGQIARLPGPPGAWMHLEARDSDPVNFFLLFVDALKTVAPDLNATVHLPPPTVTLGPQAGSERIAGLSIAALEMVLARSPLRLVMDGIDVLSGSAGSLEVIERIIDALRPPSCLVLVSRETPPLKLEALRMHQELTVLTNDDLAFSASEIERFYTTLYRMPLQPAQLDRIRRTTDGWAGGLVLVWEALRHVPEAQRDDIIDHGLPEALQGDRLAYFSEAVFSGLDEATRNFLVRSAVFETLDPDLLDRYLNSEAPGRAQAILTAMVRSNLFILPFFDEKTGWGYRYNRLFRDFLLDQFQRRLSRETRRQLIARAADLLWATGNVDGAIRLFMQAEQFGKAAAGIKKIARELGARGRFADLEAWIERLPREMVDDDAWLSYYQTLGNRVSGGRKTLHAFARVFEQFENEDDRRGQLMAMAGLIETAVFIGHPAAELKHWLATARALLERESGNPYYAFAKSVLWMQVAFGTISGAGDLQQGLSACRNAMLLAGTLGNPALTVNATIIQVFGLTLNGELDAAEKLLADIVPRVSTAYPEYRCLRNIVRMELALSRGDWPRAEALCEASGEEIDRFGLLFLYPVHLDLTGRLQIHLGRYDQVVQTANHLADVATLTANPFYTGLSCRLQALRAYHQGRVDRARQWAEKAVLAIAGSLGEGIHLYRCRLIQGILACHQGALDEARRILETADAFFSRSGSHLALVETRLARSLLAARLGDRKTADRLRQAALEMAAANGYEAFSILSAEDIAAALEPVPAHPGSEPAAVARRLMRRMTVDVRPYRPATTAGSRAKGNIARDGTATLDIRTLGGFTVHRADRAAISDAQWAGKRQRLLLKAIVVNGCRDIPKEVLADALWPESSQDVALKRFKVTLHRLRRVLDPPQSPSGKSSFVLLRDNRVSLDMTRCRVDADDFLAACDRIRHLRNHDDPQQMLDACRRAIELYRGEFLPEEPYLSWADMKRAVLRDHYVRINLDTAALLERSGDLDAADERYAAAIQADPLAEQAYQRRMRLLQRQDRRNAAIKLYQTLTRILAAELDTVPDAATTAIYEDIIGP